MVLCTGGVCVAVLAPLPVALSLLEGSSSQNLFPMEAVVAGKLFSNQNTYSVKTWGNVSSFESIVGSSKHAPPVVVVLQI